MLLEDPNGVYTTCDFPFPSFIPLDYSPENLVITEEVPIENEPPPLPNRTAKDSPFTQYHPPPEFSSRPGKNDQRVSIFVTIKS